MKNDPFAKKFVIVNNLKNVFLGFEFDDEFEEYKKLNKARVEKLGLKENEKMIFLSDNVLLNTFEYNEKVVLELNEIPENSKLYVADISLATKFLDFDDDKYLNDYLSSIKKVDGGLFNEVEIVETFHEDYESLRVEYAYTVDGVRLNDEKFNEYILVVDENSEVYQRYKTRKNEYETFYNEYNECFDNLDSKENTSEFCKKYDYLKAKSLGDELSSNSNATWFVNQKDFVVSRYLYHLKHFDETHFVFYVRDEFVKGRL